jgi:predicted ATPase/class 3 adenylate cyclase
MGRCVRSGSAASGAVGSGWVIAGAMESGRPSGTVTFLFTDIEGSTAAWDRHGAAMEQAQGRHDEILRAAVADGSGYVFSSAGDGIAAAFHTPAAAVRVATAVQLALSSEPWPEGLQLRVRMGVHTGVAVERDGDYFGPDVIRAARLMGLVGGARVVCSALTASLVADEIPTGYEFVGIGSSRLKGLAVPEEVFALRGPGLDEPGVLVAAVTSGRGVPRPTSRLVGRASEVDEMVGRLLSSPLVTITGTGGVGKTRLAVEVLDRLADKFSDGVVWVELAAVSDGKDVVQIVADAVGVQSQPGVDLAELIVYALTGRRVLIALDNAEHVRAVAADLVESFITTCAGVVVLVTSRERLGVPGERVFSLEPLATGSSAAPAVELLIERIADAGNVSDDDPATAAVVEIADRLDGLPLALELAAARCRTLGAVEVAERLRRELRIVADGHRRDDRHQTLERTLTWSYEMLGALERTVLQHVSVFAGGFTLEAAHQTVGLAADDVDDAIASLVDKSLVQRRRGRFQLLQTTRQFVRSRLDESGDADVVHAAHGRLMQARVREIVDGLVGRDEAHWVEVLDDEWADVRSAVRHGLDVDNADLVIDIVIHLAHEAFWRRSEAFAWTNEAYARYGDQPGPHQHELTAVACFVAWVLLDVPASIALAERALALNPTPCSGLWCLPEVAAIGAYNFAGQPEVAVGLCHSVIAGPQAQSADWQLAHAEGNLALSLALAGDTAAAAAGGRAVDVAQRSGNPTMIGYALFALGWARHMAGETTAVAELFTTARSYASSVRNTWLSMMCAGGSTLDSGVDPKDQLGVLLDIIDEQQRAGWTTHAWTSAWFVPALLLHIGQDQIAAFFAGACATSGIQPMLTALPSQLAELDNDGNSELHRRYRQGRHHSLPDALRVARHQTLPPMA